MGVMRNRVAKVLSGALVGFSGRLVEVETDMKTGLPGLQIVGMGNKAIDEARQRVRSVISNSLLDFPAQKLTINLAPAELPKDGTHFDVPIALSILVASGQVKPSEVTGALFVGEVALDGAIRPVRGAIIFAELAKSNQCQRLFLPLQNVAQAQLVQGVQIIGVQSLQQLYKVLRGFQPPPTIESRSTTSTKVTDAFLFDSIIGHEQAKRALTIAAAGRHNILLSGSPGAGKTLLARSLIELLPDLSPEEVIEVTKLHSLNSTNESSIHINPPLRAPHHSATLSSLIGGGLRPKPGELSLAHKGVLFLDELPEYPRASLEALRQPLEDRCISLSRLYEHITYPADILLAATMNPCPCGYLGDARALCTCARTQIDAYQKKLSGPLLDRIDIRLSITKIDNEHFFDTNSLQEKQLFKVKKLVLSAREAQKKRYKRRDFYNAYASLEDAKRLFNISPEAKELLNTASKRLDITSRGYIRILRVARTIADLEVSDTILSSHLAEAIQYRNTT
jgi:magnesium chelatase family protein